LRGGIDEARGEIVVMADADLSYNLGDVPKFVAEVRRGADLVVGDRFAGGIERGAMPIANRLLGNPILSALGRYLTRATIRDFHCGMRAFRRDAVRALDLRSSGMEFASEMIAAATRRGLEISQVPTTLRVDGRGGASHLRPLADGSRHVAVLMVHSTRRLPSRSLSALQWTLLTSILLLGARDVQIASLRLSIGTLLVACLALTVVAALRVVDVAMRAADEVTPRIETSRDTRASAIRVRIVRTAVALWPVTAASVGLVGLAVAVGSWIRVGFGDLVAAEVVRSVAMPSMFVAVAMLASLSRLLVGVIRVVAGR
jgi:hypothetical protein